MKLLKTGFVILAILVALPVGAQIYGEHASDPSHSNFGKKEYSPYLAINEKQQERR